MYFEVKRTINIIIILERRRFSSHQERLDLAWISRRTKRIVLVGLTGFPAPNLCTPALFAKDAANKQHYEVDTAFYRLALGPRLKYSSGLWPKSNTTLEESEVAMLDMYCQRAQLEDGMKVRRGVRATTSFFSIRKSNHSFLFLFLHSMLPARTGRSIVHGHYHRFMQGS